MRRKRTKEENRKYYLNRKLKMLEQEVPKKCAECGNGFLKSEVGFYKFCSKQCKEDYARNVVCAKRNAQRGTGVRSVYEHGIHWEDVWAKGEGKCQDCGSECPKSLRGTVEDLAPEVDHILPISLGGAHIAQNLQLLCHRCNNRKGNSITESEARQLLHLARENVDPVKLARINIGKTNSRNTSGYRGVTYDKSKGKWKASCSDGKGNRIYIGRFNTAAQAGRAVAKVKMKVYGYV